MDQFGCQTCMTSDISEPKSEWFRLLTHTNTHSVFYNELWWVAEDAH